MICVPAERCPPEADVARNARRYDPADYVLHNE